MEHSDYFALHAQGIANYMDRFFTAKVLISFMVDMEDEVSFSYVVSFRSLHMALQTPFSRGGGS